MGHGAVCLKALSDYNLRSTTMRNMIFDRHLRGRYAQEKGYVHTLSCREGSRVTARLAHLRGSPFASLCLGCLEI